MPDGFGLLALNKKKHLHVSLAHRSCAPVEEEGWELAEWTAPEAQWSRTRSEGLGQNLASQRLPSFQDLAPPLSVG